MGDGDDDSFFVILNAIVKYPKYRPETCQTNTHTSEGESLSKVSALV